ATLRKIELVAFGIAGAELGIGPVGGARPRLFEPVLGEPVRHRFDVVDLEAEMVQADGGFGLELVRQDRQAEIAVGQEMAAAGRAAHQLHVEIAHVEIGDLVRLAREQREMADLRLAHVCPPSCGRSAGVLDLKFALCLDRAPERTSNPRSTPASLISSVAQDSEIRPEVAISIGEFPNRHTGAETSPSCRSLHPGCMLTAKNRGRTPMRPRGAGIAIVLLAACLAWAPAGAADFYQGKTLTLIAGFAP